MSKADTVAFEYAKENGTLGLDYNQIYDAVKYGYHQAEKDLTLTWEDINRIEIIIKDVYRDYPHGIEAKQFGVEVLNRFNKQKGE